MKLTYLGNFFTIVYEEGRGKKQERRSKREEGRKW
jgi:hypothetical protein